MICTSSGGLPIIHVEAECAFGTSCNPGMTGTESGAQTENAGTTVGYLEGGDWLSYSGITLDGYTSLKMHYAKGLTGGSVEVHLDTPTGALLGATNLAYTGAWTTWSDATIPIARTTGTHALVFLTVSGTTQGIYNLDWFELSSAPPATASVIHTNQLGYELLGPKYAVVEATGTVPGFDVLNSSGTSVWCGTPSPIAFTEWGGSTYYSLDFSGLTVPGTYTISAGGKVSASFEIAAGELFTKTFPSVLGYFKQLRADDAPVWTQDGAIPFIDRSGSANVQGGWYDAAGDISKYLTHLSYANFLNPQQIPLVAWSLAWVRDHGGSVLGTQANAVQAEALWGADYLLRVLDPAGYFYATVFDKWTGVLSSRLICAFSGSAGTENANYEAAFREGGGMSIAALARIGSWGVAGSFQSSQYIAGAEKAFVHLTANNTLYDDDGKENVIDDYAALLAASELYAATSKAQYLTAAQGRAANLAKRLSSTGYFIADDKSRPFWHASDAGLPVVALARYVEIEPTAAKRDAALATIKAHLDYLVTVTGEVANPFGYARQTFVSGSVQKNGFFIPHDNESGYWWQGENARLASLAAAALIGGRKLPATANMVLGVDSAYAKLAGTQIDWILGANPFDMCFLEGFGSKNPDPYCSGKPQSGTVVGGICNGITGSGTDGSGIQWLSSDTCGNYWRWNEQWLPHAAWYIVAITAMAQ